MAARTQTVDRIEYQQGVQRVLLLTLVLNLLVVAGKLTAGIMAGSLSVISDAVHSSVDSLNNVVGLVIVRFAQAEPDDEHPYGHAKFETLAAFAIAGFLFVTCYQIGISAFHRLFSGETHRPEITRLTVIVMLVTIVANLVVTVYEHREGKRLKSEFLIADAIHTRSDVIVSCSIVAGLALMKAGYYWVDPVASLGVAVVIAWNGYKIFRSTVPVLVDAAPVAAERIAAISESVPGVHSVHDVRSRGRDGEMFIEMHMHLEPGSEQDHIAAHAITEEVEHRLGDALGRVIVTIHVEPLPQR
ncbi:MAG: cation diffusion facilitator family transporter [Acidobacteriota bacterium]